MLIAGNWHERQCQFLAEEADQLELQKDTARTARGIYQGLREQILTGVYSPGDRLPSTRSLAEELGVSRTTVTAAFDQLISEGYVTARQGAKATVAAAVSDSGVERCIQRERPDRKLSEYAGRLMSLPPHLPGTQELKYDFRYGDVAGADFPMLAWRKALAAAVLMRRRRLAYGHPAGSIALRQALQGYLWRARGIRCDVGQIVMVSGSQQAVDLCSRVLAGPGDRVLMEDPCYAMARNVFFAMGAETDGVPCDAEGMDTRMLPPPGGHRLVVVTPSHQFPLGGVLSASRRRELVEWAEAGNAHILEDDYDGEYRYDVKPIPPLYLSGRGRVIYVGTVSKTLSPTLRIGYLVLPEDLVEPFVRCKQLADRHGATFEQEALASCIESGAYERHIRRMRRMNSERRDAFLEAMARIFGDKVEIVGTSAGLHVVVWFNGFQTADEVRMAATARDAGVGIYPVSRLYSQSAGRRAGFVFGYASIPVREIPLGVQALAAALHMA